MIPKLIANEKFYETIEEDDNIDVESIRQFEEPIEEFLNHNVYVYTRHTETWVGKNKLFDEYKHALLDDWGYCPSVDSLVLFLTDIIASETSNYLVTARLVNIDVAEDDESLTTYINENGDSTDMDFFDYVGKYGRPVTQYKDYLLYFNVFVLE